MKVLRLFLIFATIYLWMSDASAQFRYGYWRIGVSAGSTNYLGDLDDDLTFRFTKPGFGINGSYRMNPFMSARLSFFHGWAGAADSVSANIPRNRRNLHFRTPITEGSFQIVFDFVPHDRRYNYRPVYVPYVFGGMGLFRFNPQAYSAIRGAYVPLQPVGTEGQNLDCQSILNLTALFKSPSRWEQGSELHCPKNGTLKSRLDSEKPLQTIWMM